MNSLLIEKTDTIHYIDISIIFDGGDKIDLSWKWINVCLNNNIQILNIHDDTIFFNIIWYNLSNDEYRVTEKRRFRSSIETFLLLKFIKNFIDNFFDIFVKKIYTYNLKNVLLLIGFK